MRKTTVAAQLAYGFGLIVFLLVMLGGFALFEIHAENGHVAALRDNWMASIRTSLMMKNSASDMRLTEFRLVAAPTPEAVADALKRMDARTSDFEKAAAQYKSLVSSPEEGEVYRKLLDAWGNYLQTNKTIRELAVRGDSQAANATLTGIGNTLRDKMAKEIEALIALNTAGAEKEGQLSRESYSRAIFGVCLFVLVAAALAIAAGAYIVRRLTGQLGGEPHVAADVTREVARGNLAIPIHVRPGDRHSLMHSLSEMQHQLRSIVGNIQGSSASITQASREIAQGNTDLSSRTEEQAASLEETASSMEQLSSTVRQNAESARKACELAERSSATAERGGVEIERVATTMQEIEGNSEQVAKITAVIESIAFQTNILALNAGVEAARAGEHGRGFAVVATEVRALSQRSASAAREIKELIQASTTAIDNGVRLVSDAGRTMQDVVSATDSTLTLLKEVALASAEQSQGIAQVDTAIAQMDQVTQQNAALVEESSAATQQLASQAEDMQRSVSVFIVA